MNTARLNQGTPLLLNGVTKRYGDNTILNALDLHIPAGQFVAVVGRSGGGKSTLLRLLAGLEAPNSGDILAGTTPLATIQDDTRMMFQDARLLAGGRPGGTRCGRAGESRGRVACGPVGWTKAARSAGTRADSSSRPAAA